MSDHRTLALGALFRQYNGDLLRFLARLTGSREAAEDVAQEAYLRLLGRGEDAAALERPKTYLFTTARNAALDLLARRRLEASHAGDCPDPETVPEATPLPDAAAHHRRRLSRMAEALNDLPAPCRRAFLASRVEGLDHRTIAAELGISVSMVEKHVARALAHCRRRLQEPGR